MLPVNVWFGFGVDVPEGPIEGLLLLHPLDLLVIDAAWLRKIGADKPVRRTAIQITEDHPRVEYGAFAWSYKAGKPPLLQKQIVFGTPAVLCCDGRCDKAWGISGRPKRYLSEDNEDDHIYLKDIVLGTAPDPSHTVTFSEGGHMKPSASRLRKGDDERLNKWCARQCERSAIVRKGEPLHAPNLEAPQPNIPLRYRVLRKLRGPESPTDPFQHWLRRQPEFDGWSVEKFEYVWEELVKAFQERESKSTLTSLFQGATELKADPKEERADSEG
jgi:hypothetical protein